ncbi:MAG: hypothetical protein ABR907_12815 [Terracidiphilus sp.]|jgi:hypothetical protein
MAAVQAIEQRWYPSTALDDLLEIKEGRNADFCDRGLRTINFTREDVIVE